MDEKPEWIEKWSSPSYKIALVYPPSPFLMDQRVMPPLGLLYLGATLKMAGHEVALVDFANVPDWSTDRNMNKLLDAEIVGITSVTPQFEIAKGIKNWIKDKDPRKPVLLGGVHASSIPDECVKEGFDAIATGEGEQAVLHMIYDYSREKEFKKIYTEPLISNLDTLPFPDRDLVDIKSYNYEVGGRKATTYFTQRGCPYRCSYCESPLMGGFKVRYRSPESIAMEAKHVIDKYGLTGMMFFDDEFNLDYTRTRKICALLKPLDIRFRCFAVAAKADETLLRDMKESGCVEVAVGIESGSDKILKNIHKPATKAINRKFIETAKKVGLHVKAFMIVGLPGETWETIRETKEFLDEIKIDDVNFSILQVYPGSFIAQSPLEYDLQFGMDYSKSYTTSQPGNYEKLIQISTSGISAEEIVKARNYLEHKFKPQLWKSETVALNRRDFDEISEMMEKKNISIDK